MVKFQRRGERTLTSAEKAADRVYAVKKAKTSAYRLFNHVAATSVSAELMTLHRRCINPSTLEAIFMFRYIRDV